MTERVLGKVARIMDRHTFSIAKRTSVLPPLNTKVAIIRISDIEIIDPDSNENLGNYEEVICHAYITHSAEKYFEVGMNKPISHNSTMSISELLVSSSGIRRPLASPDVQIGDSVVLAE